MKLPFFLSPLALLRTLFMGILPPFLHKQMSVSFSLCSIAYSHIEREPKSLQFDKFMLQCHNIENNAFFKLVSKNERVGLSMYKKLFSMLLAASLALSLTACGGSSKSTVDESDDTSSPATTSSQETTSDSSSSDSYSGSTSSSSSSRSRSSNIDPDDYSFEDYLKDNDPDSYEFYQDLEEGWNSGEWDSESGFVSDDSYNSDNDFEDYLYENDRDSYDSYQSLEDGWSSGTWDSENGFFQ